MMLKSMTGALGAFLSLYACAWAASGDQIVIGDIDDLSGVYADVQGQGGIEAANMAIADLGGTVLGKKIIVLNFFATWCGPCREEMPELNTYFNTHKAESFLLVGIDAEENQDRVEAFLADLKVDFPAGIDAGPIQKQYGVSAFPTTVLIGVDGKVQFYEAGALANAEVAFDNLLTKNRQLIQSGQIISREEYRLQAQKQPALPVRQSAEKPKAEEDDKLDARGKRIVSRMDCPCGCEKKVQGCTCSTSKNIKNALASEDFKDKPDDEIVKALNKRFCSGAM